MLQPHLETPHVAAIYANQFFVFTHVEVGVKSESARAQHLVPLETPFELAKHMIVRGNIVQSKGLSVAKVDQPHPRVRLSNQPNRTLTLDPQKRQKIQKWYYW